MTQNRPDDALSPRAITLRDWVAEHFDLDGTEQAVLADVLATITRIDVLDTQVAADGVMVAGSQGQQVLHPGIAEARQQRGLLARLVPLLALPEDDAGAVLNAASAHGKRAADARWSSLRQAKRAG